jgi:hypothetical protein
VTLCLLLAGLASAQLYDVHECGGVAVNWAKQRIAAIDPADARAAERFERLLDLYWTDPAGRWCSATGARDTGWGREKGLAYFALYDLGRTYRELERAGVRFSARQREKLDAVLRIATEEAAGGTYYYFGVCNLYRGRVNRDNSCGEDDMSIAKFLAMVRNLFPAIAARCGGEAAVETQERRFFDKAFSSDYRHGGGLCVIRGELTLPNHGGPSWPYAAINLISANNARDTYLLAGKPLPAWYRHPNVVALFAGLQAHALPDGSAFTDDCTLNRGSAVPCNDPGLMDAEPMMVPAGRFVRAVFGDAGFLPGLFTFERCDEAAIGSLDRINQYCNWNPGTLPLGVVASAAPGSALELRWTAMDGARAFDVWLAGRRVAAALRRTDYIAARPPCNRPLLYAVYARGAKGRTLGGEWGLATTHCTPSREGDGPWDRSRRSHTR